MGKKNKKGKSKKSVGIDVPLHTSVKFGQKKNSRNSYVLGDVDPQESLNYLQEMFHGELEADVVSLIFFECANNVDQTFETLIDLLNDADTSKKTLSSNYPLKTHSFSSVGKRTNQSSNGTNAKRELSEFSQSSSTNSSLISHNTPYVCHESQEFSDTKRNISSLDYSFSQFGNCLDKTLQISGDDETLEKELLTALSKWEANLDNKNPEQEEYNSEQFFSSLIKKIKAKQYRDSFRNSAQVKNTAHKPLLIILRGLPGSGKSTLGRALVHLSGLVYSTDDYFLIRGKYQFDSKKLSEAHDWNKLRTAAALEKGITPIVIDNTNAQSWEMKPYVALGIQYRYEIHILEPNTPWKFEPGQLVRKTHHEVSKESIERMLQGYEHGVTTKSLIESISHSSSQPRYHFQDKARSNSEPQSYIANNKWTSIQNSDKFKFCSSLSEKAAVHREDDVNQIPHWIDAARSNSEHVQPPGTPLENFKSRITNAHASINNSSKEIVELSEIEVEALRGGKKLSDIYDQKVLIQRESKDPLSLSCNSSSNNSNLDYFWNFVSEMMMAASGEMVYPTAENKVI